MSKSALRVDLLGTSFSIAADESPEYLQKIRDRYRAMLDQVRASTDTQDPLKLSILTGIVLCDELEKITRFSRPEAQKAEQAALDMIERMDEVLRQGAE